MKKISPKMISTVSLIIFTIIMCPALAAQADGPGSIAESAQKPSTAFAQDLKIKPDAESNLLIEESVFHRFIQQIKGHLSQFGQQLRFLLSNYSEVPVQVGKALDDFAGGRGTGQLAKIFFLFGLLIAVGYGVERLFNAAIKKHKQRLEGAIPKSFLQLVARLSARAVLELISLAVFALTILGFYLLFYPTQGPLHELAVIYLPPIFIMRLAFIVLNTLYSPKAPHMRVAPQNCPSAAVYFIGFMAFITISLFATKTLLLLRSHGLSEGVFLLLYSHLGLVQFIILLTILWKDRGRISNVILKKPDEVKSHPSPSVHLVKRLWFPLACLALLGFELLWQINLILYQKDLVLPLLLTILSIPFGFLLFSIGNRLLLIASGQTDLLDPRIVNQDILQDIISKGIDLSKIVKVELPPEPVSALDADGSSDQKASLFRRNLPLIRNLMGILISFALLFWVMNLWGLDLPLGRAVVQSLSSIFATLLLAYVIWEVLRTIIDRMLEEERAQSGQDLEDAEEGTEGSRKGTLLTLLRKVIIAMIGVIVVLVTLNAVGINIGPMLAGAGILGLAIGFGSQALVRDILSGVFFLMDDAFRVGDFIETAGTKGSVEHISLRSLRLRHPRGMVYTIPFGDMGSVQNFSRDYIITKLDVRVRYDADIDKIRKIIKKISKELEKDENTGQLLLSKIKSQGVREMDDSAMIVRVKFKTKPGDQFVLRREVYRRIQERFRDQGIEFAHRNVTVYLPPEVSGEAAGENQPQSPIAGSNLDKKLLEAGAAAAIAASQAEEADKKT